MVKYKAIREEFEVYFRKAQKINSTEGRSSTVVKKGMYEEFLDKIISHEGIELEDKILFLILFSSGCRVSEVVGQDETTGIRVEQIDLNKMRITGVKILKKRGRTVRLEKALYPPSKTLFLEYLKTKTKGELVINMSRKAASRRFYKYFGITDIHSSRHAFVTSLFDKNMDPVKISALQGWSDSRFGFRYYSCDVENELEAIFKKAS